MISVVCSTVNAPTLTRACLQSLLACREALAAAGGVEFVLIDDHSDPQRATLPLLSEFRETIGDAAETKIVRFKRRMHYTHALAYGLSLARGDQVLFTSQDMVISPPCIEELVDAARRDERIGVIRPTSQHMDWAKTFVQSPPANRDASQFAAEIRQRFAGEIVDWPMLIGDAMLIARAVIDRIGVFDTRYRGFMGDIDYGVRLHRAGFRHVIARGAWLHHEGAGTAKESGDAQAGGEGMMRLVQTAYAEFRRKWGEEYLPPHFRDMRREHFERLHALAAHRPTSFSRRWR